MLGLKGDCVISGDLGHVLTEILVVPTFTVVISQETVPVWTRGVCWGWGGGYQVLTSQERPAKVTSKPFVQAKRKG